MIAPVDFTQELELYLYLADSVIKNFGFKGRVLPQGSELELPRDWWSVWRCEVIITDPEGEYNVVLFTNENTLISFICPGYADDFDGMIEEFEAAFLSCLKANGLQLPDSVSMNLTVMVGEPEEFVDDMWWMTECATKDLVERKFTPAEAQMRLHSNPCSEVGGESPGFFFLDALEKNPPWGAKLIPPGDVIPFPEGE
jgi:hypothetical protein